MSPAVGGRWPEPADEVRHWLIGELVAPGGARTPMDVDLAWGRTDPLAVRVVFLEAGKTWLVGRELLGEGLVRRAGGGDVEVRPCDARVQLLFSAPGGAAVVRFAAAEVMSFLVETYQLVGPDEAAAIVHAQIEASLAVLLGASGGGS